MPGKNSILIIDDEQNLRATLAMILERAGYAVSVAADAQEALYSLEACPIDLVFLDLKMPGVQGTALLAEIRREYPAIPVLILTAHASLGSAIDAVRQGVSDYLLKPADPTAILLRVGEILGDRGAAGPAGRPAQGPEDANRPAGGYQPSQTWRDPPALLPGDPGRFLHRKPLMIDRYERQVTLAGRPISLTPVVYDYLLTLAWHAPAAVPCETLVMESQGYRTSPDESRSLAGWHIHKLQQALEPDPDHPQYILAGSEGGYRLVVDGTGFLGKMEG